MIKNIHFAMASGTNLDLSKKLAGKKIVSAFFRQAEGPYEAQISFGYEE